MSQNPITADPFAQAVGAFADDQAMLPVGGAVVVGVSGGADSVALLAALRSLSRQPARRYRLIVAHLNHQLRPQAQADEQFVRDLAAQWQLPCVVERADVTAEARRLGQGIEQAARMVRYDFLRRVAGEHQAGTVAVAHHADDQVETVLYRIIRGTHLRGLAGIPASRPLDAAVRLVRPLLFAKRTEIEQFLTRQHLAWRTDDTNRDTAYRRNFIRHHLLPLLREQLNPRVDEAVERLARGSAEVEAFVAAQADQLLAACTLERQPGRLVLDRLKLADQSGVLSTYALRQAMDGLGVPMRMLGTDRLEEAARMVNCDEPAALSLPGGFAIRRAGDRLILAAATDAAAAPLPQDVTLDDAGPTKLGDGRTVLCERMPFDPAVFQEHCHRRPPGVELLDADQLRGRLFCRPRQPGDVFQPLGCAGRQSVSDFLTNAKLPPAARDAILCIGDDNGIVYVSPLRIDDRVKVTARTQTLLKITLR